jgi:hypothetical protein
MERPVPPFAKLLIYLNVRSPPLVAITKYISYINVIKAQACTNRSSNTALSSKLSE